MTIHLDDEKNVNWISELQRRKGRLPPRGPSARSAGPELLAYEGQPRQKGGKFGKGKLAKGGGAGGGDGGAGGGGQLAVTNDMGDFNELGQATILSRATWLNEHAKGPNGAFPKDVDEMADVLEKVYADATPEQIAAGKVWYQGQHDQLMDVADELGVDHDVAIAITANMSPGRDWDYNLELAKRTMTVVKKDEPFTMTQEKYDSMYVKPAKGLGPYRPSELTPEQLAYGHPDLSGKGTGGSRYETTGQVIDGVKLMRGDVAIGDVLTGTKVRNFYNNIREPSDPVSITVDIHQIHAQVPPGTPMPLSTKPGAATLPSDHSKLELTYYTKTPTSKAGGVTDKIGMYPMFGSAIQKVAKAHGLLPNQVQAITWLVQRKRSEALEAAARAAKTVCEEGTVSERGPGQLDPYDFDPDSEQAQKVELYEHLAWVREYGSPEEQAALAALDETDPAAGLDAVPAILRRIQKGPG